MGRGQGKRRQNNSRRKGGGNGTHNNRNASRSNGNTDFVNTVVDLGNYKMEAYYAAQGLHDTRWNEEDKLVACETDEEKEVERQKWRTSKYRTVESLQLMRTVYSFDQQLTCFK
jgi:outer membrane receptor for ferrienterochelin and colicin